METNTWSWKARNPLPPLSEDRIHLWHLPLDRLEIPGTFITQFLSPEESNKANRFRFQVDQQHYQIAHTATRVILANYLRVHPAGIRFENNTCGKPSLLNSPDLRFNLSHAVNWALFAVAFRREIGVDIEVIRPELVDPGMVTRSFTPAESRSLAALPPDQQAPAFFKLWTRKEALAKAVGTGLSLPLEQFEVSLQPDVGPVELRWLSNPPRDQLWSIQSIDPPPGCAAALAAQGAGWQVEEFRWERYF